MLRWATDCFVPRSDEDVLAQPPTLPIAQLTIDLACARPD